MPYGGGKERQGGREGGREGGGEGEAGREERRGRDGGREEVEASQTTVLVIELIQNEQVKPFNRQCSGFGLHCTLCTRQVINRPHIKCSLCKFSVGPSEVSGMNGH